MTIQYRPEIDGLRAIAVVSVIIYHADILINGHKMLAGGFFGVDVFFVISGFLITSLMISEFDKTGIISISAFYERRARRLLPALLVVMVASLPFAWLYLLPSQLIDFSKSLLSSLFFGSNVYWHFSLQEYGVESSLLKPFLHTWSLAVEEQFYIVFPLVFLAMYKWFKSQVTVLLAAGFILSFMFAVWMTSRDTYFSFYLLPSRIWELLAGALLANIIHLHVRVVKIDLLNKTMPSLGILLILYAFFFTEYNSGHPGLVTLVPIIGTVLIIGFANEREPVTQVLSSKLLVYIGLISYSLYLWHYPIFAFLRIDEIFYSSYGRAIAIALTIMLSIISVTFIESPIRNKILFSKHMFLLFVISLSSVVIGYSILAISKGGFENRFESTEGFLRYEPDNKKLRDESWTLLYDIYGKAFDFSKTKVLIVGNSHAKDIFNAFYQNAELYRDFDFRSGAIHEVACFDKKNTYNHKSANKFFDSKNYNESHIIVISTRYVQERKCRIKQKDHIPTSSDIDGLYYLIKRSLQDKKRVIVFGNAVEFRTINGRTIADSIIIDHKEAGDLQVIANDRILFEKLQASINRQYFTFKDRKNKQIIN